MGGPLIPRHLWKLLADSARPSHRQANPPPTLKRVQGETDSIPSRQSPLQSPVWPAMNVWDQPLICVMIGVLLEATDTGGF